MENEKKNNGLVILVIILIILVLALCGYIIYGKMMDKKETSAINNTNQISGIEIPSDTTSDNQEEKSESDTTTNEQDNNTSNLYDNTDISKDLLDQLYYIIGVLPTEGEKVVAPRHCLNVAVTDTGNDAYPTARDVFSWYVMAYNKSADYNKYKDATITPKGANTEISAYNCAACITIEKNEVEKFKSLYYFDPEEEYKFIYEINNYDNIYGAVHNLGSPMQCKYNVKHNIIGKSVKKYTYLEAIIITDKQVVTRYDDLENNVISQVTNQIVNYMFTKKAGEDDSKYKLDRVLHQTKYE